MTDITVTRKNGNIVEVSCAGHTGYGEEGEDIVCAGLSSIVQTALLGLLSVAHVNLKFDRDVKKGTLHFSLPDNLNSQQMHDCQIILMTMLCGLSDFNTEFSDFMKLEVIE